ncbi:metal ABC transporter solute-binding protein, Zn/Mn family [Shimia thalassica]|uniref:metal ABC transporter solute-binding protein, Zn/Mn family n=1 Tax=Shimia thalassica TaxID=1715693 RepID=UPI0026E3A478|nr:zinc ABC transporter substrate-binding protein [Shimia thalassica]MDO6797538.1 zinc ABC transporter substrate-binding protein [Shimia thalassica]
MRFSRRDFIVTGTLGAAALATPAFAQTKLSVVATTGMIADTVRRVGGDNVDVKGLMGAGVDPHSYRQTRTDILAMTRADLILWHGLFLEAQMEEVFRKLETRKAVFTVTDTIPKELLRAHPDYDNKFDPHVWMVPALWTHVALRIRDILIEARPELTDVFTANAAEFLADLAAIQNYAETALPTVPQEARILVTAHDAFSYFGRDYGFEVMGIQGISTDSEAGLNRIGELVDILVDRKVGAVFVESSVSDRSIRALTEGAAARGHKVMVGGELFSDAMGAPDTYEGTYLGMIDHNVTVITNALGGQAPERGLNGKLAAGF